MPVKIVLKFLSLRWLLKYNYNYLYEQGRGRGGRDWELSSEEKCGWRLGRVCTFEGWWERSCCGIEVGVRARLGNVAVRD